MIVYKFDSNGFWIETKQVNEDYELGLNETTIAPSFKLNNRSRFDGTAWQDLSENAYMHDVPAPLNEKRIIPKVLKSSPNPQKQMLSQLALQQAQFQASQQKVNSQLALQLAQLTVKGAK